MAIEIQMAAYNKELDKLLIEYHCMAEKVASPEGQPYGFAQEYKKWYPKFEKELNEVGRKRFGRRWNKEKFLNGTLNHYVD